MSTVYVTLPCFIQIFVSLLRNSQWNLPFHKSISMFVYYENLIFDLLLCLILCLKFFFVTHLYTYYVYLMKFHSFSMTIIEVSIKKSCFYRSFSACVLMTCKVFMKRWINFQLMKNSSNIITQNFIIYDAYISKYFGKSVCCS